MKTGKKLYLMRHAKAGDKSPEGRDFDRPLNALGVRAAGLMGAHLKECVNPPKIFLCSPALRTRQTLEIVQDKSGWQAPINHAPDLYAATSDALLAQLAHLDESISIAMIIGHNPAIHDLAQLLAGRGRTTLIESLEKRYPTAGFAEIELYESRWSELRTQAGHGRLVRFDLPRHLP